MAFLLPSVLKALLFSSGQPLAIKDIQTVIARYKEQNAPAPAEGDTEGGAAADNTTDNAAAESTETPAVAPTEESAEVDALEAGDEGLPELITDAQIREALAAIEAELRESGDVYLLLEGAQGWRIVTHPRYARWVRALRNEPPPAKLSASAMETLAVVAYRQPVTRSEIETIRGVSADAGLNKLLERELIYITGRAELPGRPLQYGTTEKFLEFVGVKSLVELPASDVLSPRQIDSWLKDAMNPSTPGDAEMGLPLEEGEGETPMEDEAHIETETETAAAPAADESAAEDAPADDEANGENNDADNADESPKPQPAE